ncbi:MAG: dynein regulatory complex subunit 6-like [Chlamydiia bacterium]|nr:dynein regulatory complex subunit 6-like [Chlamydiia bacterium]
MTSVSPVSSIDFQEIPSESDPQQRPHKPSQRLSISLSSVSPSNYSPSNKGQLFTENLFSERFSRLTISTARKTSWLEKLPVLILMRIIREWPILLDLNTSMRERRLDILKKYPADIYALLLRLKIKLPPPPILHSLKKLLAKIAEVSFCRFVFSEKEVEKHSRFCCWRSNKVGHSSINVVGCSDLVTYCPFVQHLTFQECSFDGSTISYIHFLSRLTSLVFSFSQITDDAVAHLTALPSLTSLTLSRCSRITDLALQCLQACTQLKILTISSCDQVENSWLQQITPMHALTALDLSDCWSVTDHGIEHVLLPRLKSLKLSGCWRLTDGAIFALSSKRTILQNLELADCGEITDAGIGRLSAIKTLEHLNISGIPLTDNSMKAITNLRVIGLKTIKVAHNKELQRKDFTELYALRQALKPTQTPTTITRELSDSCIVIKTEPESPHASRSHYYPEDHETEEKY